MASWDYIVDVDSNRLVSSFTSTRTVRPENAVYGDKPDITVRFVEANATNADLPWRDLPTSGYSARVGIGTPGGDPTAGTFTLTFGADTTTALSYDATAAQIETALDALTSITAAGGVTVTTIGAGFQIEFDSNGAQSLITANTSALYPSSSATIWETQTGDVSTPAIQVFVLETDNAGYVELTSTIAAPSSNITVVREGVSATTSELVRVELTGDPYQGTFSLTVAGEKTDAINIQTSTLSDIATAVDNLASIGAGNTTVTGVITDFTLQFNKSLGDIGTVTVDTANLTGAAGYTGSLDLNTTQMLQLLNGAASKQATLEIVRYDTGNSTSSTVLQVPITCKQDVIPDTPPSTTGAPAYAAAIHTHVEADISNLGTAITLNADADVSGNTWVLDEDTLSSDSDTKLATQQSIKAYVDAQISGLGNAMEFKGSYDANTTDPTDGGIGDTYVVTVAGTGVASFWSTALEIGDVIIQENDPATTEADWVVVSKDIGGTPLLAANDLSDVSNAATARGNLSAQEDISGATITSATVAGADKVLIQDADDSDNLKVVTAQSVADLSSGPGLDFSATVYVSADGNDSDSGLNVGAPKLTISGAITAAATLISGGATGVRIEVLDGETYTENITLADKQHLHAPAATLTGSLTLAAGSSAHLNEHYVNGANLVSTNATSGDCFYKANYMECGVYSALVTAIDSAIILHADVKKIVANGVSSATVFATNPSGRIVLNIGEILLSANSTYGLRVGFAPSSAGFVYGQVGRIVDTGFTGTTGISTITAQTECVVTVGEIVADTAYNVSSGDLHLVCPSITGTETGTPTVLIKNTNTGDEVSATDSVEGIVELATQAEVDTGTDTTRVVTPSTLANYSGLGGASATTTTEGIVELATQAEVDTGTDTTRVVTPSTLANYSGLSSATTTTEGVVELATTAQIDAETPQDLALSIQETMASQLRKSQGWVVSATPETVSFTATMGELHLIDLSGGGFNVNLPNNASAKGRISFFVTAEGGASDYLTIIPDTNQRINGTTGNKTVRSGYTELISAGGSDWYIVDNGDINGDLKADGSVAMTSTFDFGGRSIVGYQQTLTGIGTTLVNWNFGNHFRLEFGAQNETPNFTAPPGPCMLTLVLEQDVTGGRTVTWPGTVHWAGGTAPTLSTGGFDVDIIRFYWDGTIYFGSVHGLDFQP